MHAIKNLYLNIIYLTISYNLIVPLTLDIKKSTKCSNCGKENCQTIWILTHDNNQKEEIVTCDCQPDTYNKLPDYININNERNENANEC